MAFKKTYNAKVAEFDKLAADLSVLVQQYTAITLREEESDEQQSPQVHDRMVVELDRCEQHTLDENFTYKRPYGYRLGDSAQSNVRTWRRFYELVCLDLARRDAVRFSGLPDDPRFQRRRGNTYFSRNPDDLRFPIALPKGVFAEVHLSANSIRDEVKHLLKAYGIDHRELSIYLREDRDAE